MITTFYGESADPAGAAENAHHKFDEWQRDHDDIEILQIATAASGSFAGPSCFGFWLTIHWRWNEDPQRYSGGGDLAEVLALRNQVEPHSRTLLDAQSDTYEGSKARR